MNLYTKNLFLCFFAAFLITVLQSTVHFFLILCAFAPFIVIVFYQKSFRLSLWISLGCGWIADLLSSHEKFGLYAISFTVASSLLYKRKRHFFADHLSTLPLMTFFYSAITTLTMMLLIALCEKPISFSGESLLKDFFLAPIIDGVFAFSFYILPFLLLGKKPKRGEEYFLKERG